MDLEELLRRVRDHILVVSEAIEPVANTRVSVMFRFRYPENFIKDVTMSLEFFADSKDEEFNGAKWRYLKQKYSWN